MSSMKLPLLLLLLYPITFYSCGKSESDSVPQTPTDLSAVAVSTSQIDLAWLDKSSDETGFKIERKTGSESYSVVATATIGTTTYSDKNLTAGTTYTYRVNAFNSAGNSVSYSNEASAITQQVSSDGSITIGAQVWMAKNLDVDHYRNGDQIPQVTDSAEWVNLTTGAWCYYNNDPANGEVYGRLYNKYAMKDPRGLAPEGWHVPTLQEMSDLIVALGGPNQEVGGKLKSTTGWNSPNVGATNSSGFTALPGGVRHYFFEVIKDKGFWWLSHDGTPANKTCFTLLSGFDHLGLLDDVGRETVPFGFSVRCIKD